MITSPDASFIFSKFLVFWVRGVGAKRAKRRKKMTKWPTMTKKFCQTSYLGTVPHMIVAFGTHV